MSHPSGEIFFWGVFGFWGVGVLRDTNIFRIFLCVKNKKVELEFDIRGNFFPYQKVSLPISDFKERFVDSFDAKSSRKSIFLSYETYTYDFRREITPKLTQWINGSFVSNKVNPRDIDLVNLVDQIISS